MTVMEDLLTEDAKYVVSQIAPLAQKFKGSNVLVTGASGLIGSLIVICLSLLNKTYDLGLRIFALGRSKTRLESKFNRFYFCTNVICCQADINNPISFSEEINYIVHGANPTSSRFFVTNPVETLDTAIVGTRNILNLARDHKVQSMVYLSSLEIYGVLNDRFQSIKEYEMGFVDTLNVRSSYSEGKRVCETLCVAYASEYNVPVKITRLSQTFGAGVDYYDGRVFADFMRCALENRPIVLHSKGNTIRNYCYTADTVYGIILALLNGINGEAYNIANEDTSISIREMAEFVQKKLGSQDAGIVFDIPKDATTYGYNPEMVANLDASKLKQLGWSANYSLEEMFMRMAQPYR